MPDLTDYTPEDAYRLGRQDEWVEHNDDEPTTPKPQQHIHAFGPAKLAAGGGGGSFRQCDCGYYNSVAFGNGWEARGLVEKGVRDATV